MIYAETYGLTTVYYVLPSSAVPCSYVSGEYAPIEVG